LYVFIAAGDMSGMRLLLRLVAVSDVNGMTGVVCDDSALVLDWGVTEVHISRVDTGGGDS
jgi:hypothetical protein